MNNVKVVAIPDKTRIIINYGYEDDKRNATLYAKEGQKIAVVSQGVTITDPDSNSKLGEYTPIKKKLEITDVFKRFSVARSVTSSKENTLSLAISPMLKNFNTKTFDYLPVNEEQILDIPENNGIISVGDMVVFLR
ncbi:hypothetical protein [Ligilactobacillus agilis]|uniref:hypothetical protein n=1 Tax=Ligilactobacillus agilis TaxID=1601 RepID=UPI003F898B8E|nr:hypothetical protein [Ligilactobacillus agilis]